MEQLQGEPSDRSDLEMYNMSLRHKQEEIQLQLRMNERQMQNQRQPQWETQQRSTQMMDLRGFNYKERGVVQGSSGRQSQRELQQFGEQMEMQQLGSTVYSVPQLQSQQEVVGYGPMAEERRGGHGARGHQDRGRGGEHAQVQMQMYRPSSPTGSGRSGGEQREVQQSVQSGQWQGMQQQTQQQQRQQMQQHQGTEYGDAKGDGWYGKGQGNSSKGGGTGKGRGADEMGSTSNRRQQPSRGYPQ
jgi:hypothetical protein